MTVTGPTRVEEIIDALRELGGEAEVSKIKDRVRDNRHGRPSQYRNDHTYRNTIQKIVEDHCPESDNYCKSPFFERVAHGRYRLINK